MGRRAFRRLHHSLVSSFKVWQYYGRWPVERRVIEKCRGWDLHLELKPWFSVSRSILVIDVVLPRKGIPW